jgi:hypothetical protein
MIYRTTKQIFSRLIFLEAYDLALMAISFVYISTFSKKMFSQNKLTLNIKSAELSGGQGKLNIKRGRKLLFLIYILLLTC